MGYRNYAPANGFIVSKDGNGDFTTIASALAVALSGTTIYIHDGTYIENITLVAGVNLCSFDGSSFNPNVVIIGTITANYTGICTITGIQVETPGTAFLVVSGVSQTALNFENCFLNYLNATGISYSCSNSNSEVNFYQCVGNIASSGITPFTMTSAGSMRFLFCQLKNTGSSTTASTCSSGTTLFYSCTANFACSTSSTGQMVFQNSGFDTSSINTTAFTTAGTGNSNAFNNCVILSGSAACVSIGTGTTVISRNSNFSSGAANVITGAGTFINTGMGMDNASTINPTTYTQETFNVGNLTVGLNATQLSQFLQGTFSPTVIGSSGGAATGVTSIGRYLKINKVVWIWVNAIWTGTGTMTGNLQIGGIPTSTPNLTSENTSHLIGALSCQFGTDTDTLAITAGTVPAATISPNAAVLRVQTFGPVGGATSDLAVTSQGSVAIQGWYYSAN